MPAIGNALVIALLVISLGVHEAAHGWVALKCGDTTARDLGRITLNPIAHIDPFMTIILPAIMIYTVGFPFGGAKPVPVAFHRLRKPHRDMALVALAGPASNILIAAGVLIVLKVVLITEHWSMNDLGAQVLGITVWFNMLLAAFNMVPIPPLDGSRVMAWLLPPGMREPYVRLERIGMFLVIGAIMFLPGFGTLLGMTVGSLTHALELVVSLGGMW